MSEVLVDSIVFLKSVSFLQQRKGIQSLKQKVTEQGGRLQSSLLLLGQQ